METGILFPIGLLLFIVVAVAVTLVRRGRQRPEYLQRTPSPLAGRPDPSPQEDRPRR